MKLRKPGNGRSGGRAAAGFTLLEVILVVALVLLLLSLLAILAGGAIRESQKQATIALIGAVESALDTYYQIHHEYPPINIDPGINSTINTVSTDRVKLAMLFLYLTDGRFGQCMPNIPEAATDRTLGGTTDSNRDYSNYPFFTDAWRSPLQYVTFNPAALKPQSEWGGNNLNEERRKWGMNGGRPLIWSLGPDGRGTNMGTVAGMSATAIQNMYYSATAFDEDNISNFHDIPLTNLP